MYKDIGNKIKTLAGVICWIGILAFGFVGVYTGRLMVAIIGAFASWIGTFVLYGFGELIDQTTQERQDIEEIKYYLRNMATPTSGQAHLRVEEKDPFYPETYNGMKP